MNNIQKAFKAKSKIGLRMADGGFIPTDDPLKQQAQQPTQPQIDPEWEHALEANKNMLMLGSVDPRPGMGSGASHNWLVKTNAEMGVNNQPYSARSTMSRPSLGLGNQQPVQRRPAQQIQQPDFSMRGIGMAEGGIVKGKGGPTDDEVPMNISGTDVNLSNSEAVLPAKTVQALGGPKAVEALIEHTNGKPPVKSGLRSGGEYGEGVVDPRQQAWLDKSAAFRGQEAAVTQADNQMAQANAAAAATPAPTAPVVTAQAPAPVAQPTLAQAKPVERPWYAGTDSRDERTGLEMERARRTAGPTITGDPVKQMLLTGTLGDGKGAGPATAQPTAPSAATAPNPQAPSAAIADKPSLGMVGTQKFDAGDGKAAEAYSKAGYNTVTGLRGGKFAVVGQDAADAARDAEFAKAGTKKDAFGNWVTPQLQGMKAQLAQMQQDRLERDAFDPSIKDPTVRGLAQAKLGMMQNLQIAMAKNAPTALDIAKFDQEERKMKNLQSNNERDFKAADDKDHTAKVADLVKSWATDTDGKLDNQKYAALQKYAGQFKRGKDQTSEGHLGDLMDNFAVDSLFDKEGRHFWTSESNRSGEAVLPIMREAGLGSMMHGRLGGQQEYVNPLTNETIYQSDVTRNLSPRQQQILSERVAAYKAKQQLK